MKTPMIFAFSIRARAFSLLAASVLLLQAARPQAPPERLPLTTGAVAQALKDAGITARESQILLPLEIATISARPTMVVSSAEALPSGRLRVRLVCSDTHDCLPFFAIVQYGDDTGAKLAASFYVGSSLKPVLPIRTVETAALRPGEHAVLLLEDKQMQITLPVLLMDGGALGSTVRVSSLDRKRVYVATIVAMQVVRGALP